MAYVWDNETGSVSGWLEDKIVCRRNKKIECLPLFLDEPEFYVYPQAMNMIALIHSRQLHSLLSHPPLQIGKLCDLILAKLKNADGISGNVFALLVKCWNSLFPSSYTWMKIQSLGSCSNSGYCEEEAEILPLTLLNCYSLTNSSLLLDFLLCEKNQCLFI